MAYTYILECSDGTYYTGSTRDLLHRLGQHQRGEGDGAAYTARRLPVRLVYYEEHDGVDHAFLREKQIQGWTHGKKKRLIHTGPGVRPGA